MSMDCCDYTLAYNITYPLLIISLFFLFASSLFIIIRKLDGWQYNLSKLVFAFMGLFEIYFGIMGIFASVFGGEKYFLMGSFLLIALGIIFMALNYRFNMEKTGIVEKYFYLGLAGLISVSLIVYLIWVITNSRACLCFGF